MRRHTFAALFGAAIALGDHQRRRHDFRRDMRHGRAMHVAHRGGGDEISVEQHVRVLAVGELDELFGTELIQAH